MSLKNSYWTGVRAFSTSNSQWASLAFSGFVSATRSQTDTYVRSLWWARLSYFSDGTGSVPAWWQNSWAYLAVDFDHTATHTAPASLTTGEPADRIAIAKLPATRVSMPEYAPFYSVDYTTDAQPIESTGRRKGDGTNFPRVVYGIKGFDQDNYLDLLAEPSAEVRAQIFGRVLWESDF